MIPSMRGRCSSDRLVMSPLSLTRWVIGLRLLAWELGKGTTNRKSVLSVMKHIFPQVIAASTATHAAQPMRNVVMNVGIEHMSKRATTKRAKIITTGEVVHHHIIIRRSPTNITGECASFVERELSSFTTKMRTDITATSRIYNLYVNVAIKFMSTIAQATSHSSVPNQRYSQTPQQCGTHLLNYGKAANSLARDMGVHKRLEAEHPNWSDKKINSVAKEEAQKLIDIYFERIPGAAKFIKGTYKEAAHTKYVETFLGRRRWLHQIMDYGEKLAHMQEEFRRTRGHRTLCWCPDCKASREGERRSANTIIQGTAADIVMCAMIKCYYDERLRRLGVKMLLQIHDELVFECPEENVEEACKIIQYIMENPGIELSVPLRAEPGFGDDWVAAK